jgi:uncharacterized protein YecE (DUF72 family)
MKKNSPSPQHKGAHELRIGPAGWSYSDWAGYVYPTPRPKNFHEAQYLAQFFDTIEINTSFYSPLRPEHAALWLEKVSSNPNFLFTAKLWQKFTHDPSATAQDERDVRAGFDVIRKADKLGAILLQFPFAFHHSSETTAYLHALIKRFADYPLVVELRHASWYTPDTLKLLQEHHVGFCNIDQPIIGRSIEPSADVTSPIGYVRLHGRRYDTWFTDDPATPPHERYNYLYSKEELDPWIDRIRSINQKARQTYVISNNHFQGKAIFNALQILNTITHEKVKVPDPLRQHYPELNEIASEMPAVPTLFPLGAPAAKTKTRKRFTS